MISDLSKINHKTLGLESTASSEFSIIFGTVTLGKRKQKLIYTISTISSVLCFDILFEDGRTIDNAT